MAHTTNTLRILAQPKALYRERYASEQNIKKKQASRFIRADENPRALEYPTLQVNTNKTFSSMIHM